MSTSDVSKLPQVTARVGNTLVDVRDHSSYRFDFSRLTDDDLTPVTEPCVFIYDGPMGFRLPPTRFVSINSVAATVIAIRTSPQLDYLDQAGILSLSDAVAETVLSAGWVRTDRRAISREELLMRLKDESGPEDQDWIIAGFAATTVEIDFRIRRLHRKKGALASVFGSRDQFLLNLQCRDDQLARRAGKMAMRLREMDGLPADSLGRPINLDAYTARLKLSPPM